MRNLVLLKIDLTDELKPLSQQRLVATFSLFASEKNTQDTVVSAETA